MGQQDILMIVLSILLVAIAVQVGITMFNAGFEQSSKDMLALQLQNCALAAYQHYLKPVHMGGADRDWAKVMADSSIWLPTLREATTDGAFAVKSTSLILKIKSTTGNIHKGQIEITSDGRMIAKITQ